MKGYAEIVAQDLGREIAATQRRAKLLNGVAVSRVYSRKKKSKKGRCY